MKLARDLMTTTVCKLNKTETAEKAFLLLKEHNFHHLVVVNNKKVVGMVSTFDLLDVEKTQKVEAFMHKGILVAVANEPVDRLVETMIKKKISALPVVNLDRELEGIITQTDILKYVSGILKAI